MIKNSVGMVLCLMLLLTLSACTSPEEKAAEYIESGNQLLDERDYDRAILEFKNALQINQNLPDAWYGMAKIQERRQNWKEVYQLLLKIQEMAPGHVDSRIMLAQILLASNQLVQALEDANEILEMAPDDARSHSLMAAMQFRLENFKAAEKEIEQALAIDPENNEAILVRSRILIVEKEYTEAVRLLDQTIKQDPKNVSLYLMKIQAYQELGESKKIEGVYLSLIQQFPDGNTYKLALVRHYIGNDDLDNAESVLEQLVQSDSDNVELKLQIVSFTRRYRSLEESVDLAKTFVDANGEEYRYRFLLAALYESSNQGDNARKVYEEIVAKDGLQSDGLEARNKIALISLRAGDREKAEVLVSEVLGQDKNNENGLLLQAGFFIANGEFDDAVVSARTVLRDNPDSVKALGLLGQAYGALGSRELAMEAYTKAFQINKSLPVIANQLANAYVQQRDFAQADKVLQESMASGNRNLGSIALWAQVKLALGEWDKAEQLARELKKVEGQEALSEQLLGVVYQGKEKQDESIEAFKRAHELAPNAVQPIVSLVRTYVVAGKLDEARQFLNSVLAADEENVTAILLLGQLSQAENNVSEAIVHFNKVIEINPELDIGYRSLATLYRNNNDISNEQDAIERGLAAIPDSIILRMGLAFIYERQSEFNNAIAIYEAILELNPELLVAKNNLASLMADHRQDQESLERARQLATEFRSSTIPQFRDTYAWASVMLGTNLEEAVVIFEGIVKDNPEVDVYNFHLGEAYRKKGDSENAMVYLSKAIELSAPGSDVAEKANSSLQQLK